MISLLIGIGIVSFCAAFVITLIARLGQHAANGIKRPEG